MRITGNKIYEDQSVSNTFFDASNILYRSVYHTLGSKGLNTAIPTENNYLSIINDGKTIIEKIADKDPAINLCLNTLKESSLATNYNAGDGTTSTIVLQHRLLQEILNYNDELPEDEDRLPDDIPFTSKEIIKIRDFLLNKLTSYRKEIKSDEDLKKVITVSLGSDDLTDVVFNAFKSLAPGQKPALLKSRDSIETTATEIDGISIPTDINPVVLKTMPLSVSEPINVLIINQSVSRLDSGFTKLLQKISQSSNKTVLFYTDIAVTVMDQILYNIQQSALNLVPVKLNYTVDKIDNYVEDLGKYFKCTVLNELHPYQTFYNDASIWGSGTGYILNKDSAVIQNYENTEYTSELLPSKSSVINIGFITFSSQEETYRRLEDAIHSSANALQSGYVIGGGFTLYSLGKDILSEFGTVPRFQVIDDALSFIYEYLFKTSDYQGSDKRLEYTSNLEENVYDSFEVLYQVILNSFTVVAQILSTNVILIPLD